MPHTIEPAASGRAKCRGCGRPIAKGELRFGERQPNPFADEGEMTLWFHLVCGAYKRPEPMLEALEGSALEIDARDELTDAARRGIEHRRLPRIDGAERASTGRAACRSCREKIEKGSWRIRLVFFENERFDPAGFLHLGCVREYFGTGAVEERLQHFTFDLDGEERADLERALRSCTEEA